METEKSSGVVVFQEAQERKYLLLNYGKGYWGFAKGIIEEGESEEKAAKRELEEETRIRGASFINGFREEIKYFFYRKGQLVRKIVVYFLTRVENRRVTISNEHIGYIWLPYDAAIKNLNFKNTKELLKKAEEFLEKFSGN